MRFKTAVSEEPESRLAIEKVCAKIEADMGEEAADLALLFVSQHHRTSLKEITDYVQEHLQPAVLLGCTAEAVIGEGQELENRPAVCLWTARLPGAQITPLHLAFQQTGNGIAVEGWPEEAIARHKNPVFLLLAEPFSTPGRELLEFMQQQCPGAPAMGGVASGGMDYGQNLLVLNDQVIGEGAVGVVMSGPVSLQAVVSQGCRPIGQRFIITKAKGNLIYELSGRQALECLQEVYTQLSPHEQKIAQQGGLHAGYAIDEHKDQFDRGDFLVRNLLGADQASGSIAITDLVKEGQTLQFHLRDREMASEDLEWHLTACRAEQDQQMVAGALLFSCNGRGRRLFGDPHHDVSTLQRHVGEVPVAGFFAQGEIGPVGGKNFLHGYTASVVLFTQKA